jgi:hypothetical protein
MKYQYKFSAFRQNKKKAEKKAPSKTPYKFLEYVSERK